jgi:hypothetical protein
VPAFNLFPGSLEELLGRFIYEDPVHVQVRDRQWLRNGIQSPLQERRAPFNSANGSNREPGQATAKEERQHKQNLAAGKREGGKKDDYHQAVTRHQPI